MPVIQIRIDDDVHRVLKAKAAIAGMSLSDYLRFEVERVARTPLVAELIQRLCAQTRQPIGGSAADLVRAERDSRP